MTKLEKIFSMAIQDPHFRYSSGGGGACHLRAEALAYHLTEMGYSVNIIKIDRAPTLIAMERDRQNKLNGGYYDYAGNHTLVQIMVKDGAGEIPYLLDPQFMTSAMPRETYFKKTMGQNCVPANSPKASSYLNCSYDIFPANELTDRINSYAILDKTNKFTACGWEADPMSETFSKMANAKAPLYSGLKILNEEKDETDGLPYNEDTYKNLILRKFKNYPTKLSKQAASLRDEVAILEPKLNSNDFGIWNSKEELLAQINQDRKAIEQIEHDLANIGEKIKEVENNLK